MQLGLEGADLPGQRGLRDVQLGGGPPEVEMPGHGHEVAEFAQVDVDASRVLQTPGRVLDAGRPPGAAWGA
ncbi:hypothetical protein Ade02nite_15600 [Paractinoplanes deccanensis]|uniref:Uncharacterized protein n=1 Tax=Paractinoplanes deccanensis TaxID=113561 RepID=A0ABQ3XYU4_9ACTN|nr:hypothetical protein Ade02nite_15600 [Actinoplanes deccanensis]